jgi:hypothetical protein
MGFRDSEHVAGDKRGADVWPNVFEPLLGDLPKRCEPGVGPSDSIRRTSKEWILLDLDGERKQFARGREATDGGGRPTDAAVIERSARMTTRREE